MVTPRKIAQRRTRVILEVLLLVRYTYLLYEIDLTPSVLHFVVEE
jgi:hypothetical protein